MPQEGTTGQCCFDAPAGGKPGPRCGFFLNIARLGVWMTQASEIKLFEPDDTGVMRGESFLVCY
jgi:hypothetical protein